VVCYVALEWFRSVPGRSEAMRDMSSFSGFRGTPSFYHGFYAPKIVTPTIHILGQLDTMVSNADSEKL